MSVQIEPCGVFQTTAHSQVPRRLCLVIFIVGTSHTIQTTAVEFKPFLESLCRAFNIRVVAEEMSSEALAARGCAASIPMQVADAMDLTHQFCDPTTSERVMLQIWQESDIRAQSLFSTPQEAQISALIAESHAKRERYWLAQIRKTDSWPVLFVCGADHVESFYRLLELNGIVAHVAAADWGS
jgi:hypothetical protein